MLLYVDTHVTMQVVSRKCELYVSMRFIFCVVSAHSNLLTCIEIKKAYIWTKLIWRVHILRILQRDLETFLMEN